MPKEIVIVDKDDDSAVQIYREIIKHILPHRVRVFQSTTEALSYVTSGHDIAVVIITAEIEGHPDWYYFIETLRNFNGISSEPVDIALYIPINCHMPYTKVLPGNQIFIKPMSLEKMVKWVLNQIYTS